MLDTHGIKFYKLVNIHLYIMFDLSTLSLIIIDYYKLIHIIEDEMYS